MKYGKYVSGGYIIGISTNGGQSITEPEYTKILSMLRSAPTAPDGFVYRLTAELEWELCELPIVNEADEEISGDELLSMLEGVL